MGKRIKQRLFRAMVCDTVASVNPTFYATVMEIFSKFFQILPCPTCQLHLIGSPYFDFSNPENFQKKSNNLKKPKILNYPQKIN